MYAVVFIFVFYLGHQSQFLSITCVRAFPSVLHNINTNSVHGFVVSDGVFEKDMHVYIPTAESLPCYAAIFENDELLNGSILYGIHPKYECVAHR